MVHGSMRIVNQDELSVRRGLSALWQLKVSAICGNYRPYAAKKFGAGPWPAATWALPHGVLNSESTCIFFCSFGCTGAGCATGPQDSGEAQSSSAALAVPPHPSSVAQPSSAGLAGAAGWVAWAIGPSK